MNEMMNIESPESPVATLQVFGLVTQQGTAMSETAYCVEHRSQPTAIEDLELALSHSDEVDKETGLVDVSENEAMFCQWCGLNGFRETYWDYNDDPFADEEEIP